MSNAFPALAPPDASPDLRALPDPSGLAVPQTLAQGLLAYISASRLKCWQTCRRQFYFRYVEKIPTPTAPALYVGRQVHELLRTWNWARWKDEPVTTQQLQARFIQSWDEDQLGDDIRWKSDDDERKAKDQSWKLIETYLDQCPVDVDEKPEGVEVEVECDLGVHGLPPLFGIIDLVRPGGVIVDYKTAARSPNPRLAVHQHQTQLGCYALLYREATGEDESGFELHHLIKTKEPKIVVTKLDSMSPAQEIQLYRLIDDYLAGIAAERWIPSPGQHCGWCDYFQECRSCTSCGTGKGGGGSC